MIKNICLTALVIALLPEPVYALDFSVQPRFKTGVQYYEIKQDNFQSPARDLDRKFPNQVEGIEYKDWIPYIDGGLTFFVDRFFVDFNVQYAFNGEDQTDNTQQIFLESGPRLQNGAVLKQSNKYDTDFDRFEWSISAGFTVIENLVFFAGYKQAETNLEANLAGSNISTKEPNGTSIPGFSGPFTGRFEQTLKYDGPFVGASYHWRIKQGFLDGALSFNFAAAFLDGTVKLKLHDIIVRNERGQTRPIDLQGLAQNTGRRNFSGLEGDSTGYSFGASWRGFTPVDGLTYSLGVNAYLYDFESDVTANFSETQVRLDFGLAYAFEL